MELVETLKAYNNRKRGSYLSKCKQNREIFTLASHLLPSDAISLDQVLRDRCLRTDRYYLIFVCDQSNTAARRV